MKQYLSLLTMILLSLAGLAFVSCDEPQTQEPVIPVFPEAVTVALEADESYTIEFEPNTDWSVSLDFDKESAGWFWIQNGNFQDYSARGKAGEKAAVTICAGSQTDYDSTHSCTVVIKMGGEKKTIGTFTRGTVDRAFSLAYCKVEEADLGTDQVYDYEYNEDFNSDIKYAYEPVLEGDKPVIPLAWLERTQDYRRSILISANFDWHLKSKPEWLNNLEETGGRAGEQIEFDIEGNPRLYPLDDAVAELVFCAKKNRDAEYTFRVQIPGCRNIFGISGFSEETEANAAGEIYKETMGEGSWSDAEMGVNGTILGREDIRVYTFVYYQDIFNSFWDNDPMNTEWITATLDQWTEDGAVVQNRNLNVKVAANDGPERQAIVLAMPADEAPEYDYSIFPNGSDLDPMYEKYVVTRIVQAAYEEPGPGPEPSTGSEVAFVSPETVEGAALELVDMTNLESMMAKYPQITGLEENVAGYGYKVAILTYTSEYPENASLIIPDYNWFDVKPGASGPEWLTYDGPVDVDGQKQMTIHMTKPAEGADSYAFINFYETMETIGTVIYCIPAFAEEGEGGGGEEGPVVTSAVSFASPETVVGATLDHVGIANIEDMNAKYPQLVNEFDENVRGQSIDVSVLTYTAEQAEPIAFIIPKSNYVDVKPGMDGPEWLTVKGPTTVGGNKQITIQMTRPAEDNDEIGIINIFETMTSSTQIAIIYCIPAF